MRLWVVTGALLVLALVLSFAAAGPNTLPGDRAIGRAVQRLDTPFFDAVAAAGNFLGEGRTSVTIAVALLAGALVLRRWRDALFLTLLVVLRLVAVALKGLVESPRPTAADLRLDGDLADFGFPSGHTISATVLAGALVVLLVRHVRLSAVRWVGLGACVLPALAAGFARVYVGAHWPSDVLGGYLWGAIIVLLALLTSHLAPLPAPLPASRSDQAGTPSRRSP